MAAVHLLPNEILLRIFSHFEIQEVFDLDKVCQRWRDVCKELVWSRVACIDEKIIDYPYGSFLENLIKLCHRVESVNEFFTGVSPVYRRGQARPKLREAVVDALCELLKKLARDSALPLSVVEDILVLKYPMDEDKNGTEQLPPISEARATVAELLRELRVGEFEAVEVSRVALNRPELGCDPFSVSYKDRRVPLLADLSGITRLHIGCLVALAACDDKGDVGTARTLSSWISCFPQLETVVLHRLEFLMPAYNEDEAPLLEIALVFHPHRCRLSTDGFLAFLRALGEKNDKIRTKKIVTLIDEWKNDNCIESSDIVIHTVQSDELTSSADYSGNLNDDFLECNAATSLIIDRVYPSLISKLHLLVYHEDGQEESVLVHLKKNGIFSQLKEFSVSFTNETGEEREDPLEEIIDWHEPYAASRAKMFLRHLSGSMHNLEKLKFDFTGGGKHCPYTMFEVITVYGPLPRLQELCYDGLPSFPFIISVLKQAPNLRCLNVSSQHFEDERGGVKWISQLLDAAQGCRNLSILTVRANRERWGSFYGSTGSQTRSIITKDNKEDRQLFLAIQWHIRHLVSVLPKLYRMSIVIDLFDFRFDLNRGTMLE